MSRVFGNLENRNEAGIQFRHSVGSALINFMELFVNHISMALSLLLLSSLLYIYIFLINQSINFRIRIRRSYGWQVNRFILQGTFIHQGAFIHQSESALIHQNEKSMMHHKTQYTSKMSRFISFRVTDVIIHDDKFWNKNCKLSFWWYQGPQT